MTKSSVVHIRDSSVIGAADQGSRNSREQLSRALEQMSFTESGAISIGKDQLPSRANRPLRTPSKLGVRIKGKRKPENEEALKTVTREEALVILQQKNFLQKQSNYIDHNSNSKDVYLDFPNKFDCPRTAATLTRISTSTVNGDCTNLVKSSSTEVADKTLIAPLLSEVVEALRGSYHRKPDDHIQVEEMSPLIHHNSSNSSAASNSFDNVVASSKRDSASSSANSSQSVNGVTSGTAEAGTSAHTTDTRTSLHGINRIKLPVSSISNSTTRTDSKSTSANEPNGYSSATTTSITSTTTTTSTNNSSHSNSSNSSSSQIAAVEAESEAAAAAKCNKKRNILRIMIPKEISAVNGVKQLSAAETRKMEEAIELANSFSRIATHEQSASTPRTPGGGSTSKESLSSSLDSPTAQRWFNFKKKFIREEKKSLVDELNSTLAASPNGLLTPEAQEAYNSLVAQNPPLGSPKKSPSEKALPEGYELSMHGKERSTTRRKRSSHSDSEKYPLSAKDYQKRILSGRHTLDSKGNSLAPFKPVKGASVNGDNLRANHMMRAFHFQQNVAESEDCKSSNQSNEENSSSTLTLEAGSSINSNTVTPVNTPPVDMSPISNTSQTATPKNKSPAVASSTPVAEKVVPVGFLQRSMSMFEKSCNDTEIESQTDACNESTKAVRNSAGPSILCSNPEQGDSEWLAGEGLCETELKITEPCDLTSRELSIDETTVESDLRFVSGASDAPTCVRDHIPPPPVPPRIPLRQSTLNNPLPRRRFPLPSDPLPERQRTVSEMVLPAKRQMAQRQASCFSGARSLEITNYNLLNQSTSSSSASSTSGSEQLNISTGSEDNVFNTGDAVCGNRLHLANDSEYREVSGCFTGSRIVQSSALIRRRRTEGSIKDVKMNAQELGIHDKSDLFWAKHVTFDIPNCSQSEADLRHNSTSSSATDGVQGRYDTSDGASYEDLLEFALEVEDNRRKQEMTDNLCEEIKLMRKVLSEDISVEDCMEALNETCWDLHSSIKLIKLKQLLSINLADKQQCKQALMFCGWNIDQAAAYLLVPPEQRRTPDLVNGIDR